MISGIGSNYTSLDAAAMRKERFQKLDSDSDGSLTKNELASALPQNGKGPSVDTIFSQADTNQDGAIDEAENDTFLQQMESSRPHGRPPGPPPGAASGTTDLSSLAQSLFKSTDADSDGKISQDELSATLSKVSSSLDVSSLFKQADTDEDGAISESELETSLKQAQTELQASWALLQAAGASGFQSLFGSLHETGTYSASATSDSQSSKSSFSAIA